MLKYVLKRILAAVPVVLASSFIIFSIVYLIPGSPASSLLGMEATPEAIAELNTQLGFDQPFLVQYFSWLLNALRGDFGQSIFMRDSVSQVLLNHIGPTISLAVLAEIFAIIVGYGFAVISVFHKNTLIDRGVQLVNLIGQGVPSFVLALINLLIFAVFWGWFPVSGYRPLSAGLGEHLKYMILPALSIGFSQAAYISRISRNAMLDVVDKEFIINARLKGLTNLQIFKNYIFRNSLIGVLTAIGQSFGTLMAGSIVVETVFGLPGLGQLLMNSISRRDYAVIMGVILFISLIFILVNLIVDILYVFIDPRIQYEEGGRS